MKKIIVTLALALGCLLPAIPAQAQLLKFGIKGGLNMAELDAKGVTGDNTTGFFIGPMAEVTIPLIGLGVDGAVMYSQRGKDNWKQQGIEIPLNLKYTIGLGSMLGIYLAAGPDFFFNFKDIDIKGLEAKKTQVGINLGAGIKLLKHLQVGVNYQIPTGDSFSGRISTDGGSNEEANIKTKTWQVSLAYTF